MEPCDYPSATIAFFALVLSFLSLWIYRAVWLWGAFLLIACFFAYLSHLLAPVGLSPLLVLLFCYLLLKAEIKGALRVLLFLTIAGLSVGLLLHLFPGFSPWIIQENFALYFDTPFIGIFLLGWAFPLIK